MLSPCTRLIFPAKSRSREFEFPVPVVSEDPIRFQKSCADQQDSRFWAGERSLKIFEIPCFFPAESREFVQKLARASGIPVDRLAGEAFKPERVPAAKSPASSNESDKDPGLKISSRVDGICCSRATGFRDFCAGIHPTALRIPRASTRISVDDPMVIVAAITGAESVPPKNYA